jgi:chromosomal replication initiation ATPase DnaA
MSALAQFHADHKARLARFAQAAARHRQPQAVIVVEPTTEKEEYALSRRQYETTSRIPVYMPIAQRILRAIANEFEITVAELLSENRDLRFSTPRHFAVGMMLEVTNMSLPAIGRRLGGRDHTTILNSRARFQDMIASEAIRNRFDQIKARVVNA